LFDEGVRGMVVQDVQLPMDMHECACTRRCCEIDVYSGFESISVQSYIVLYSLKGLTLPSFRLLPTPTPAAVQFGEFRMTFHHVFGLFFANAFP